MLSVIFMISKAFSMAIRLKNTSTQWFLLVRYICYDKKVYCLNWLPWTSTRSSHLEVFLEINLNQKTLKLFTSWMHWKSQCRSTIRKCALLWNKHEYYHYADIFVKNIFNPFDVTGLFLFSLNYLRKLEVS